MLTTKDRMLIEQLQKQDVDAAVSYKAYKIKEGIARGELNQGIRRLRSRLADVFLDYANGQDNFYIPVATACGMDSSTIRKILLGDNSKGKKDISDVILGSICVGLGLNMNLSQELFELYGTPLEYGVNVFLSITYRAIEDKDDIECYINELNEYGVKNVKHFRALKKEKPDKEDF